MLIRDAKGRFERFDWEESIRFQMAIKPLLKASHRDYGLKDQTKRTKEFAADRRESCMELEEHWTEVDGEEEMSWRLKKPKEAWETSRAFLAGCVLPSRWLWPPSEGAANGRVMDFPPPTELRGEEVRHMNPMSRYW